MNSNKSRLTFMQTDIDYYTVKEEEEEAVIRIYGVTPSGETVLAHVHLFEPYFYAECPSEMNNDFFRHELLTKLNTLVPVRRIETVIKESMLYYQSEPRTFFKIFTHHPKTISSLRPLFEKGIQFANTIIMGLTYESNIPFVLRYMVDRGLVGMCWLEIPPSMYAVRTSDKTSLCALEIDVHYADIEVHPPEGEWAQIAPLKILSFDIECNTDGKCFPTPDKNEVVQIGCVCKVNEDTPIKHIFTLQGCAEIAGTDIQSFDREEDLLMAFRDFVVNWDPDIITGYNILNFDYVFLFGRAQFLGLKDFPYFGRVLGNPSKLKDNSFQSKTQGLRETKDIAMEGRVQLDMFQHIQREHKLSSYSLNSVSLAFLKEQKEDVHWSTIQQLQSESDETRRRIAIYCLKDCYLPLRLMEKLMCVFNYAEMARVTGVPFSYLLNRGQQIKVTSQILRKAQEFNMLMPSLQRVDSSDQFQGAFVLEPKKGFYNVPIATLDFASLYPSIMMAHNLCYCTLLTSQGVSSMNPKDYTKTPAEEYFVKPSVKRGLLPVILEDLLLSRKKVREELSRTTDFFMQKVLDGRQMALKVLANSVYGYTGAQGGQLPCLQISASVTAYGREMIELTKQRIETYFSDTGNPEVIYGDTDSVMIKFGEKPVSEVISLGKIAAEVVSQDFVNPIRLEFEKVYFPYLLLNKKKYAGLLWTNSESYDRIDMKGIESVRRDNCALTRNTINEVLRKLLIQRDVEGAIDYVKFTVSSLLQNKVDLSLLVITKAIGKKRDNKFSTKHKYKCKLAHVELAYKIQQRDSTAAVNIGDRIAYVMIKGLKGQKAYELAEDPLYALQNDLPIDFDYYLEKQLKQPLTRLFEAILPNPNILFYGEHTRKRYLPKTKGGALSKFVKNTVRCMICTAPIKEPPLCEQCKAGADDLILQRHLEACKAEVEFQDLWAECQRCQGSTLQEVLCNNRDCPIFYRREKVKKDISNFNKDIELLKIRILQHQVNLEKSLSNSKSQLDNIRELYPNSHKGTKKVFLRKERGKQIEKDNKKLLRTLNTIMNSSKSIEEVPKPRSLNYATRKNELKRINHENALLYNTLQAARSSLGKEITFSRNKSIQNFRNVRVRYPGLLVTPALVKSYPHLKTRPGKIEAKKSANVPKLLNPSDYA